MICLSAGLANAQNNGGFTWGGDVRLRNEYVNNAITLTDASATNEQDYFRVRLRLWGAAPIGPDTVFNARLAAEPRIWLNPSYAKQHPGEGTEYRYVLFDNLNLKWTGTTANGNPTTVVIGRQDILLGDAGSWWLVADENPADGSWTSFADAVRLSLDHKESKTRWDLVMLDVNAHPGQRLPIVGDSSTYSMVEQDEQGVILYASNKSLPDTQVDGYFMFKSNRKDFATGNNADIYTVGSKINGSPQDNLKYSIEGAYQWGSSQDAAVKYPVVASQRRDIAAYGGIAKITYLFKDALNNQINFTAEYLSGDKASTPDKDEAFDILWGRYPRWGDAPLFSYTYEMGGRIGQFTNLIRIGPQWTCTPTKSSSFSVAYNILLSPESTPTRALNPALFSNSGSHDRGNLVQLLYRQKFSKQFSGLLCVEFLKQGDYYAKQDLETFVRAELVYTF
ncbi:MAG: alginate export family protein [Opitutaceae bacterium]